MRIKIKYLKRLFYTFKDIGFKRLILRIKYEFKKLLAKILPFWILNYFINSREVPEIKRLIADKEAYFKPPKLKLRNRFNEIKFEFLNKKYLFKKKFIWNNNKIERLWIFNLHYFDYAKDWLEKLIKNNEWDEDSDKILYLIDYWIKANKFGKGWGWDSYTISLRIRNWMWIFQFCPELATFERLESVWVQLCWLNFNKEYCHGGNHYLENLISIIIVSSQFKGNFSKKIFKQSITSLKKELELQLLSDGGHEERSSSYHNLILDRLVELGCFMEIRYKERPPWLVSCIKKMTSWSESILLIKDKSPRFNDTVFDEKYSINKIINFSRGFLNKEDKKINGFRGKLLNLAFKKKNNLKLSSKVYYYKPGIKKFEETGWLFIRPGDGWELIFKCGIGSPPHLAAHSHSDLLSFDLFHNGQEIFSETGTSTYWEKDLRNFERSIPAHNTLQLGEKVNGNFVGTEPIDVWSVFRAGKKAKALIEMSGQNNGWFWVKGSHNGFNDIGGSHQRFLAIKLIKNKLPIFLIIDRLIIRKNLSMRSFLHLSPDFKKDSLSNNLEIKFISSREELAIKKDIFPGYQAKGFGIRIERESIKYSVDLKNGIYGFFTIISDFSLLNQEIKFTRSYQNKGEINFGLSDKIDWDLNNGIYSFK